MPYKDLHSEPFDETTVTKLEIFEDYTQAWIPTWVMQSVPVACIFDFFAGTGYDKNGIPGSPIRILEKIKEHLGYIFKNKVNIKLYFNEFEPNKRNQEKYESLVNACTNYLDINSDVKRAIEPIHFFNEDFETLFPKILPEITNFPSLVFLDQNGIKFLSEKYLLQLEKIKQTDFLYFVSSSYFWRFGSSPEFKEHVDIDMAKIKKDPYNYIHRNLISQLKQVLPPNTRLKMYPFTLKKGANIHGIIFGASHPLAVDKFLNIAWKRNDLNGQANFDIDNDLSKLQLKLFEDKRLTRRERFQLSLKERIMSKEILTNKDALDYAHDEGHIGVHADRVIRLLKKDGLIFYEGISPLVTYDNVYKLKRIVHYQIKQK